MKKKEKSERMWELDSILTAFSQELFPEEISAEPEQTVSQAFPEKKPISAEPAKGSAGLFLPERMYEPESREASAADQAFTKDESSGAAPEEAEGMNDEEIETFIAMWSSSYEGEEYSCPSLFSDAESPRIRIIREGNFPSGYIPLRTLPEAGFSTHGEKRFKREEEEVVSGIF